jgi:hypothetical protein
MKQALTVSCKLEVSPEQSIKIDATLQAFAKACEYVNQTVPPTLMNELVMQSLVYHNVRGLFGLSAQLAIHHIVTTAQSKNQIIALEDLAGIRERTNKQPRSKKERRLST